MSIHELRCLLILYPSNAVVQRIKQANNYLAFSICWLCFAKAGVTEVSISPSGSSYGDSTSETSFTPTVILPKSPEQRPPAAAPAAPTVVGPIADGTGVSTVVESNELSPTSPWWSPAAGTPPEPFSPVSPASNEAEDRTVDVPVELPATAASGSSAEAKSDVIASTL